MRTYCSTRRNVDVCYSRTIRDFGGLVFGRGLKALGIVLLRLSKPDSHEKANRLMEVLPTIESRIAGRFVVVEDTAIRLRPLGML